MYISSITGISSSLLPLPVPIKGGGSSGTAQVTISGNLDGIRANLTAGAAEPMPL